MTDDTPLSDSEKLRRLSLFSSAHEAQADLRRIADKLEALELYGGAIGVRVGKDGVWLNFTASTGKHASLRVETVADERGPLAKGALVDWCKDRHAQAERMRVLFSAPEKMG